MPSTGPNHSARLTTRRESDMLHGEEGISVTESEAYKMQQRNFLAEALTKGRTRQSWNDRLERWERPASESEEATIGRAADMVRRVMAGNKWFAAHRVQIAPQGSYHNNTNVRQEADMDLRAVHPDIFIEYAPNVHVPAAYASLGYYDMGRTYHDMAAQMRTEIASELAAKFGILSVDSSGGKAIRLKGITGSRAELDIVPCFTLHHVVWEPITAQYFTFKGIAILSNSGTWTLNYPDQHHANGIAKRARTQLRFKKNVRMLKRLRDELVESEIIKKGEVPSFLVECLVYGVEDISFLVETDDRYDRLQRIVRRIHEQLNDASWSSAAAEINGIKPLFGSRQPWTFDGAMRFTAAAWTRLIV